MLALRQRHSPDRALTPAELRRELLHDADEGMLSFDPIAPLKPHLGSDYGELVARLRVALAERYRLPEWDQESYEAHKAADQVAAASEALHVAGWSEKELTDTLGITRAPVVRDPLASPRGYLAWEPWSADDAADRFLMVLGGLLGPADFTPVSSAARGQAASIAAATHCDDRCGPGVNRLTRPRSE